MKNLLFIGKSNLVWLFLILITFVLLLSNCNPSNSPESADKDIMLVLTHSDTCYIHNVWWWKTETTNATPLVFNNDTMTVSFPMDEEIKIHGVYGVKGKWKKKVIYYFMANDRHALSLGVE